jgi:hypothetical protein
MVAGLSKPESDKLTAEVENDLQLSMQEEFARAIDKEMNSKISSVSRTIKDVMGIVKKELAIFEIEGKRGANLESCYENCVTERVFSGCERTVTKIKSSLHDDSVDMLTFLRGYFKTENN